MYRFIKMFLIAFLCAPIALAQSELDKKASEMEKNLFAPCCWAKTLDQDQSSEAFYVKQKIRQQLAQGKSVEEIYAGFEKEFGERILAQPKKEGFNYAAWIFPIVLMAAGTYLLIRKVYVLTPDAHMDTSDDSLVEETPAATPAVSPEDQKYIDQIDKELYRS